VLLNVSGVSVSFGIDIVLEGVTFQIDRREKVALIGRNGAGKTTLLKVITNRLKPDAGSVNIAKGAKIGFLRQEDAITGGLTVLAEAETAEAEKVQILRRLQDLEARIQHSATEDELEEYAELQQHVHDMEGWGLENSIRAVLLRMGFTEDEFDKPTAKLSGGEKTRLALAKLLLQEPDLLILDEPTNHLDLQAVEWLEGWVRNYAGAVLLVSHDRVFLERTAERTLEVRRHKVYNYPGGFAQYLKLRAEEEDRLKDVVAQQAAQIAKLDEFVRRFMNSQRTAQARGRQKLMNRMIENKVEGPVKERSMGAGFSQVQRSGDVALKCEKLSVGFPGLTLIRDLDWTVRWGDRWGVIGENGSGKSSLLKTVLGIYDPVGGRGYLGSNVIAGIFTQDAVDLDQDDSPLEHVMTECNLEVGPARNLLGRFLFEGDDVFRPIRTLSGGEKNKLVLAYLMHLSPNLLVLDEPTNHLDMDSREALASVLNEYKGTLILISHDRRLLSEVTTSTLDVRHEGVVEYAGGYEEYRIRQRMGSLPVESKTQVHTRPAPTMSPRELSKEIGKVEGELNKAEDAIHATEVRIKDLEKKLWAVGPGDDVVKLSHDHLAAQKELEKLMHHWEDVTLKLDDLRAMQG
jgi:ATP-binding cassette subfamily F protein 3